MSPALAAPPTLAAIDADLDTLREHILAHLAGAPGPIAWDACWRAVDKLLDQRLDATGR